MTSQRTQRRIRSSTPSVTSTPAARSFPVLSDLNSVSVSASNPNYSIRQAGQSAGLFFLLIVGAYSIIFRICHAAQLAPHVFSFWNSKGAFRRDTINRSLELNQEMKPGSETISPHESLYIYVTK